MNDMTGKNKGIVHPHLNHVHGFQNTIFSLGMRGFEPITDSVRFRGRRPTSARTQEGQLVQDTENIPQDC